MSARILVVDDLAPNVKLLEAKLAREYYDVATASDGPMALQLLEEEEGFDLVLLDVMMPGMDGFEVCRRIKNDSRFSHIPVVMVTALSDTADRVRGLHVGADDFLTKPLNDITLFARVRSLVRLKRAIDEWRLREKAFRQFGMEEGLRPLSAEDATGADLLVLEDSAIEAGRLRDELAVDGHRVDLAASCDEVLYRAGLKEYDLILVSMDATDSDPLRLCSRLQSTEQTRQVPVLLLAEAEDGERLAKGLDLGVSDYLLRPVDENELLARCRTQVRRKRYQERLRSNYFNSLTMALTDPLTGLHNRRYLDSHLEGVMARLNGGAREMALMLIDIDHFKRVNDSWGHPVGDVVLREVAGRVARNLRSFDVVARMGGEEFAAVMPECGIDTALAVAERLRLRVAETPVEVPDCQPIAVTISIGVASTTGGRGDSMAKLVKRADDALYQAKRDGRNRVVVAKS